MNKNTQKKQMEAKTLLVKAFSAGAVVAFRPNLMGRLASQKEIAGAYQKLKEMIAADYGQVDVDMLEIGPGAATRKETLAAQLEEAGVTADERILNQAQAVLDIIAEEDPEAVWATEVADPAPQHT